MKKYVKISLICLIIFVLGIATGIGIVPYVASMVVGNPYERDNIANKVLYTKLLRDQNLTSEQLSAIDNLSGVYILSFHDLSDEYFAKRQAIMSDFMLDMKRILSDEQFNKFNSDIMSKRIDRKRWHDTKRKEIDNKNAHLIVKDKERYNQYKEHDDEFNDKYGYLFE